MNAVGAVGNDPLGRDILAALAREGIDVSSMQVRENAATAVCVCFVGGDGETSFIWHIDDEVAVTPEVVRAAEAAIQTADAVLVTFEIPAKSANEAICAGNRGANRVIVQPAPALADPADAKSLPWDLVDVIVPNETEARALLAGSAAGRNLSEDDLAERLAVELAVPVVVVTQGAPGCVAHIDGVTRQYPVDTVRRSTPPVAATPSPPPSPLT